MTPEKSKYHYIKIDSITDIDPLKLSISQIQQRYIDKDNNRYALRFNKETRRIEILKLVGNHFELLPIHKTPIPKPDPKHHPQKSTLEKEKEPVVISEDLKSNPILGRLITTQETKPNPLEKSNKPFEISKEKLSPMLEENLMREDVDLDIFEGEEPPKDPVGISHDGLLNTPDPTKPEEETDQAQITAETRLEEGTGEKTAQQRIDDFLKIIATYRERITAIIRNLQKSMICPPL